MMARDRTGSRLLQQKLEEGTPEEQKAIFNGLERELKSLIVDPCANFVIQKLCDILDERQQNIMLVTLLADLDSIIDHTSGCRVLQKFIEITSPENVDTVYRNVKPIFLKTCMSQNGNHIVQRFIDILPDRIKEIAAAVKPHLLELAFDNCGCRVIQRLFDKYDVDTLSSLVDDVIVKAVDLSTNQYGNYVVQKILESGEAEAEQTKLFVECFASRDILALTNLLVSMEKTKRDQLVEILGQWMEVLEEALAARSGMAAVSAYARRLGGSRGSQELLAAIRVLKKASEYAQSNVSPAAICGALVWELRL
jgi:hypothetical protein